MVRGFGAGFFAADFLDAGFFFAVAMMMLLLLALHRHERFYSPRSKVEQIRKSEGLCLLQRLRRVDIRGVLRL